MGVFYSAYGGDLKTMLLKDFVRRGKGDDFIAPMDEPINQHFGTLVTDLNADEYGRAITAIEDQRDDVMLVGVDDLESGSPYVFVRKVRIADKCYMFPIILNARLCEAEEDGTYSDLGSKSFSLRLGSEIDPNRECSVRIVHAPGMRIEWGEEDMMKLL